MYSIEFTMSAERQLYRLPHHVQRRVVTTIERCKIRPYAHVKRLVDSPYFRLRAGDYRVLLDIKDNALKILVIEVGHRKNIYR